MFRVMVLMLALIGSVANGKNEITGNVVIADAEENWEHTLSFAYDLAPAPLKPKKVQYFHTNRFYGYGGPKAKCVTNVGYDLGRLRVWLDDPNYYRSSERRTVDGSLEYTLETGTREDSVCYPHRYDLVEQHAWARHSPLKIALTSKDGVRKVVSLSLFNGTYIPNSYRPPYVIDYPVRSGLQPFITFEPVNDYVITDVDVSGVLPTTESPAQQSFLHVGFAKDDGTFTAERFPLTLD